jgi:hypothetical protein
MSLQESNGDPSPKIFTARILCDARLPAYVMGAEMKVPIRQYTEVLAQDGPNDTTTIFWPFGETTAESVVTRSILYVPPGQ